MKRKGIICIALILLCLCFAHAPSKLCLYAQTQDVPQFYIEHSRLTDNNEVISEIVTNNEKSKNELEAQGYTLNKEDNTYTKTSTLEEYNTRNINEKNINFETAFNEIIELNNQIFNKMNELFNGFTFVQNNTNNNIENTQSESADNSKEEELNENLTTSLNNNVNSSNNNSSNANNESKNNDKEEANTNINNKIKQEEQNSSKSIEESN